MSRNTWPWLLVCGALLLAWIVLPSKIVPTPWDVLAAFPGLWRDGLMVELWTSLTLNLQAGLGMVLVSLTVAYSSVIRVKLEGSKVAVAAPVSTLFSVGRFNSFVGLPFLLTLWIGDQHWIKVTLLTIATSVYAVPSIVDIIANIPKEQYDDARVLRMPEWRVIWEVVVLGTFDQVWDVLRTCSAMAWMMLPMVEGMFRSEGGIGVEIIQSNRYLRLDAVFCIIAVVGLVGLGLDWSSLQLKKWFMPYAFLRTEK